MSCDEMRYEDALALVGRRVAWTDSRSLAEDEGTASGTGRLIDVTVSYVVIEAFDEHIIKRPARIILPLASANIGDYLSPVS
jgi:hypothetical protein